MPRKGQSYPVNDEWRARVEQRLVDLGWSRAKLAKEAGCPRSLITELLCTDAEKRADPNKIQRNQTTYLPEIHLALSWPKPQPALAPGVVPELSYIYDKLDDRGRDAVLGAARRELDRILSEIGAATPRHSKKS
jgi:hypothetical protein